MTPGIEFVPITLVKYVLPALLTVVCALAACKTTANRRDLFAPNKPQGPYTDRLHGGTPPASETASQQIQGAGVITPPPPPTAPTTPGMNAWRACPDSHAGGPHSHSPRPGSGHPRTLDSRDYYSGSGHPRALDSRDYYSGSGHPRAFISGNSRPGGLNPGSGYPGHLGSDDPGPGCCHPGSGHPRYLYSRNHSRIRLTARCLASLSTRRCRHPCSGGCYESGTGHSRAEPIEHFKKL